jgi:hypothetical protein
MSFNRENVSWESKNGKWSIGFFTFYSIGAQDGEEEDHEWDVNYEWDSFWFVSTGHNTEMEAMNAYLRQHGNPGGGQTSQYKGNSAENKRYDAMAYAFNNPEEMLKLYEKAKRAAQRKEQIAICEKVATTSHFWYSQLKVSYLKNATVDGKVMAVSKSVSGMAKLVGDWQTVEGQRVYNMKTLKLSSKIQTVEKVVTKPRYYGSNRW